MLCTSGSNSEPATFASDSHIDLSQTQANTNFVFMGCRHLTWHRGISNQVMFPARISIVDRVGSQRPLNLESLSVVVTSVGRSQSSSDDAAIRGGCISQCVLISSIARGILRTA
jgi:hypothetical protein